MNPAGQTGNLVKFDYDPAGRLAAERSGGATTAYSYGLFEKVAAVTKPDGSQVAFNYWPDGQMAGKMCAKNASAPNPVPADKFLWDGLALIDQGDSAFTIEPHVCGGVSLVETSAKSTPVMVISDFLGTTIGFVEGESFTPTPLTAFGEPSSLSANSATVTGRIFPRYTGKYFELDLKAYNFLFRNYRPDMARWTMQDPSGFPNGINNYLYVNNFPIFTLDLLGKEYKYAVSAKLTLIKPKNEKQFIRKNQDGGFGVWVEPMGKVKYTIERTSESDPIQLYRIAQLVVDDTVVLTNTETITFSEDNNSDKDSFTLSSPIWYTEPSTHNWYVKLIFQDTGTQQPVFEKASSTWKYYIE